MPASSGASSSPSCYSPPQPHGYTGCSCWGRWWYSFCSCYQNLDPSWRSPHRLPGLVGVVYLPLLLVQILDAHLVRLGQLVRVLLPIGEPVVLHRLLVLLHLLQRIPLHPHFFSC